jgi:hypothetical protein
MPGPEETRLNDEAPLGLKNLARLVDLDSNIPLLGAKSSERASLG